LEPKPVGRGDSGGRLRPFSSTSSFARLTERGDLLEALILLNPG
jgi:hypothetical protein